MSPWGGAGLAKHQICVLAARAVRNAAQAALMVLRAPRPPFPAARKPRTAAATAGTHHHGCSCVLGWGQVPSGWKAAGWDVRLETDANAGRRLGLSARSVPRLRVTCCVLSQHKLRRTPDFCPCESVIAGKSARQEGSDLTLTLPPPPFPPAAARRRLLSGSAKAKGQQRP